MTEETKIITEKDKAATTDQAATATAAKRRSRKKRQVTRGRVHILATYNNTVITLADQTGSVLVNCSAGQVGFKGPKKATPYAAGVIVKTAIERVREYALKDVDVFVKGVGVGREAAIRALYANGLNVLSIKDVTPVPHNGCRPPRPRRV
ncbi:MAG: 30S ribosomal protein S11 [Candidatus Kerfeldbacteria bacterium]|nr:30S ribosomal protein S11 [Candidatus Kerfeldbacteria bacterium]